jgi:hypothetical protein
MNQGGRKYSFLRSHIRYLYYFITIEVLNIYFSVLPIDSNMDF